MRIKCNPEKAKYAVKDGIEFHNDDTGREPVWQIQGRGCCPTAILQALGFTFERDLPPVPDGKEYEYKEGDNKWHVHAGFYVLDDDLDWIQCGTTYLSAPGCIYAIPKVPTPPEGYRIADREKDKGYEGLYQIWDPSVGWFIGGHIEPMWYEKRTYAIPIRKESCVVGGKAMKSGATIFADEPLPHGTEVLIIPKDQVIENAVYPSGKRHIIVRENKVG